MTTTRLLRNAAIGLAFSGLLAVSACGGDDDSSSDTTEATTATTASGGTATDDTATDDTATDDTATDDTATDDSVVANTDDVEALSAEECAALQEKYADLVGGDEPDFSQIDELYGELEDEVPDNLQDDVKTIREAFQPLLQLLEKYDYDFTKAAADPEFAELSTSSNTPEVQEATQRLDAFFANCEDAAAD